MTLLNAPTLATYTAAGFWGNETIYHLAARRACATPGAFAVTDRHRRLTYAALVAGANRLAGHLAGNGLHAGDRVAVWLPSRVETAIALLACSRNAYVCCPSFHRDHRVGEVDALVERVRAAALIALPGYGADGDRCDLFAELAGRDFLHSCWPVGAAMRPRLPPWRVPPSTGRRAVTRTRSCICPSPPARPEYPRPYCTATTRCSPLPA
jgi:hypothetical protein